MSYPATADTTLSLGPELTIAQAAAWREAIVRALGEPPAQDSPQLSLDLGAVTDIDSSAIQWLLATERSLRQRGGSLRLAAASAPVCAALDTLGLRHRWGEPAAPAAH